MNQKPDHVIIFDTTLRDGGGCGNKSPSRADKLEIARILADLQVDVIEAGFPAASSAELEAVRQISQEIEGRTIAALASAKESDIAAAAQALEHAESPRVHIFLPTSRARHQHGSEQAKADILAQTKKAVRLGVEFCRDIEFSPFDASRTEEKFLAGIVQTAIEAGATTVNISDTVGCSQPGEFAALIRNLKTSVANIDQAVLSVHCHNDLGLAVANSLAAVQAGARQVECTVNGIGERAGNAALEEIVMALKTRKNYYGVGTRIDTRHIHIASERVSRLTGYRVQQNKAIVGENAFRHKLKVPENEFLKNPELSLPENIKLQDER